jgi:hypothetical protein
MMRHVNRRLVLGWTSAMLAGTALAQPMGMQRDPGGGPGFGRGMNDPASYLAALKTQLHITPAQEPAWKEYADVVENVGNQMRAMHANVFESMQTATWQERQEMMNGMFQSRDEVHRMVQEAAETLKPHLTPEQQKLAATSLPGLMPFGPRGGMGHVQGMGMGRGPGMGQGMGPGMGQGPGAMPAQTQ